MPLLKPIAGHTGCAGIKHYLEKGGRALGIMVMNFAWQEERAFEDVSAARPGSTGRDSMDATRRACGNDTPYGASRRGPSSISSCRPILKTA